MMRAKAATTGPLDHHVQELILGIDATGVECARTNKMVLWATIRCLKSSSVGGLHLVDTDVVPVGGGADEGHGSLNDGSDTLSVFLNFALTKVWVPQWAACREGRFGDLRSVHMFTVENPANSGVCHLPRLYRIPLNSARKT